jgi:hypothetical protein
MVGGSKIYPVWEICGNTLVDELNFEGLNHYIWLRCWSRKTKSYYAKRNDKFPNGKRVDVFLAREILGLPRGTGYGGDEGDHKSHDTLDNTLDNLRKATRSQNQVNRRHYGIRCQFNGVTPNRSGFRAHIQYDGQQVWFPTLRSESDVAFMYNCAVEEMFGEFADLNKISEDEMPTEWRQEMIRQMVLKKLREVGLLV